MDPNSARNVAMNMLRARLKKGWTRKQIETTTYEGASAPVAYLMSRGKITIGEGSLVMNHQEGHTFRLADLLDSIEQQLDLFDDNTKA